MPQIPAQTIMMPLEQNTNEDTLRDRLVPDAAEPYPPLLTGSTPSDSPQPWDSSESEHTASELSGSKYTSGTADQRAQLLSNFIDTKTKVPIYVDVHARHQIRQHRLSAQKLPALRTTKTPMLTNVGDKIIKDSKAKQIRGSIGSCGKTKQKMEPQKKQYVHSDKLRLKFWKGCHVLVELIGGQKLRGVFIGVDERLNLALKNVEESTTEGNWLQVGEAIIRGSALVSVLPMEQDS